MLGLALAATPAGATVRTAPYTWTPASGPVAGYYLYLSVDGGPEENHGAVSQPNAVIQLESGAEVILRVAAFDSAGRVGPHSNASPPLRLCPGDFDGDQEIETSDQNKARTCLFKPAQNSCAGGDMDEDGYVGPGDLAAMVLGSDACAPLAGCEGDMNGDGWINSQDLFEMKGCIGLGAQGKCVDVDFDGNGFISTADVVATYQSGLGSCN
jgi:hypothetical protein